MMKTKIACACAVALLVAVSGACGAEYNLLQNPGFEQVDEQTGFAAGWEATYWSNPKGTIALSDEAHTGEHSVMLKGVPTEQVTDAGKRNNHLVAQKVEANVSGARRLVLRAWYKAEGTGNPHISFMSADKDGKRLQYSTSRHYEPRDDWGQVAFDFATDEGTASVTVYLRNGGEGAVWFDDIVLSGADDVLENDHARITIEPLIGARIRSYLTKDAGIERTVWNGIRPGGMAVDVAPADEFPGMLQQAPYEIEVIEPNRRVQVRHGLVAPEYAGLIVERELSLDEDSASVKVLLRVRNFSPETRAFSLRIQNCLRGEHVGFSWRTAEQLRVIRHPEHSIKGSVMIEDLAEGWLAFCDLDAQTATVALFDVAEIEKAHAYMSPNLNTVEWYYRAREIAAGDAWETEYTLVPLADSAPVIAANEQYVITADTLRPVAGKPLALRLSPSAGPLSATVTAAGGPQGQTLNVKQPLQLQVLKPQAAILPWRVDGLGELSITVQTDAGSTAAVLSAAALDDSPLQDLPAPPTEMASFPAATSYFPYGEYYRGLFGNQMGSQQEFIDRQLRDYRKSYFNTYIIGEGSLMGPYRNNGIDWISELLRKYDMRSFPKHDFLRVFEPKEGGGQQEVFPGTMTREQMVDVVLSKGGVDLELRRKWAEAYSDVILAYDLSDEPGGEHIPNYMMLQSIWRDLDPAHPVVVILNLNRTEYLPYMPVYYGDEYPIHGEKRGGRDPWHMYTSVRFCTDRTSAPVWVMLPAFGGLEDYPWQLATGPEMRLMIHLAIAAGAKGITYHGSYSPPCWTHNHYYFYTARDSWQAGTPAWDEMRRVGRQITAIMPAALQADTVDDEPFTTDAETVTLGENRYQGPAVTVSALRERTGTGHFLVVVNQDIDTERTAMLSPNAALLPANAVLLDLYDLKEIGPATAGHSLTLEAGDGRMLYCGTPEDCARVLDAVHANHCRNELPIYRIDAEMAASNGLDITAAEADAKAAEAALEAGKGAEAHEKILAAQRKLAEAIAANAAVSAALSNLDQALPLLTELANFYRDNIEIVAPKEIRDQTERYAPFDNTQDPKLQGYINDTAAAFTARLRLSDRIQRGEAAQVIEETAAVLATAKRVHAEAIPYIEGKRQ